jgi:methionyl-tRNA formyltransferase
MEAGLDTGPVRATTEMQIGNKTTGELTTGLAEFGAELMVAVLDDLSAYRAIPQSEEGVTYASKIDKSETRIDFAEPAEHIERQVRAFNPVPGAWFEFDSERYRVLVAEVSDHNGVAGTVLDNELTIACGTGAIRPTLIQRAGKPAMSATDLLRGKPIPPGTVLK